MATEPLQVLTGWKAIAAFLKRDERTAMRWAAERGLPVRRVPGGKRGPVYAVPEEIARWLAEAADHADAARDVPMPAEVVPEPVSAEPMPADPLVRPLDAGVPVHTRGLLRTAVGLPAAALAGAVLALIGANLGLLPATTAPAATISCRTAAINHR